MKLLTSLLALVLLVTSSWFEGVATGGTITYITPTNASNSNGTWPAVNGTYTQNFGIAFTTGPSGPFDIDWVSLGLSTSGITSGTASLTVALRNTNNTTAYSAVAGTTEHAKDTVSFLMPTSASTNFILSLTSLELPNLTAFSMQSNTTYSLILYAPSVNIAMQRTTGIANGATNAAYTVTNGFTMLDTFRNNTANYTNTATSYPTFAISFGATTAGPSGVPEPSTLGIGAMLVGGGLIRRFRKRFGRK